MDSQGNMLSCCALVYNITKRKQSEQQMLQLTEDLKRSNEELEQFAYVASHDLQEPLRAVTSYAQLLAHRYQGNLDAKADKYINYIVDGATRMQQLINDLLVYSRLGSRSKEFELADCNAAVNQSLSNLQIAIAETKAVITCDRMPTVMADEFQLVQLFQNLLANGIKFCREDIPLIHIAACRQDGEWVFSVRDRGIGIEPQYADRIFIIFQRLHSRREYSGTGIGLAMCKRIVERHGGRIWVESQEGKGATFYFTIPIISI
jgi:light-regulated signal transduction histidine kinase (bacteriophytochrome)